MAAPQKNFDPTASVPGACYRRLVLVWIAHRLFDGCDYLHWIPGYKCQLVEWSWMLDAKFKLGIYIPADGQNA